MRRHTRLLFCILAMTAIAAHADVFMRLPRTATRALENIGARTIQSEPVKINGNAGEVAVLGLEMSAGATRDALARTLKRPELAAGSGRSAMLFDWSDARGKKQKILILPTESGDHTLAIVMDMPERGFADVAAWPWSDIPALPGFDPDLVVEMSRSRLAMVSGEAPIPPEALRQNAAQLLSAAGWAAATPAAGSVETALYARADEILLLSVLPPRDGASTASRILLLRRRPRG